MNQINMDFILKNRFDFIFFQFFLAISILIFFSGCDGDGNSGSKNATPVVDAGSSQTIRLPDNNQVQMTASASDDGLPAGSVIRSAWSKESGTGNVTFSSVDVLQPTVSFDSAGTYVLKLVVSDGDLSASDTVTVIVNISSGSNAPPVIDAGDNQTIRLPENQIQMTATASDDGLPGGSVIRYAWSKESGEGNATFSSVDVLQPTVTFDIAGTYVLKLVVSDGDISASDTVTVVMNGIDVPKTSFITQYGITWTFDKEYQYGQYATGDYWVAGPVKIIGITPHSIESEPAINNYAQGGPAEESRVINGSMINVDPENWQTQGFSSGMEINYAAARNKARPNGTPVSGTNSIDVPVHSSLISSITRQPVNGVWQRRPLMDSMAILTVVETLPDDGDFRPPYTGTEKTSQFNISDLDYSFLPSLEGVAENPDISTIEKYFKRPWIDYVMSYTYRDLAPLNNMPCYGRAYAAQTGMAALTLSLNFTNEEKETLMKSYVQLGLDLHGSMKNGMEWHPNGGFFHGRKLPILFAGNALESATILNDLSVSAAEVPFQEDATTFYVTDADILRTNDCTVWKPNEDARRRGDIETYSWVDIGMPEWGVRHNGGAANSAFTQPQKDNRYFDAGYRLINGNPSTATALAVHILGLKEQWNWNAFLDYQDRHAEIIFPHDDSVFYSAIGQPFVFAKHMWKKYRTNYSPVFVSDPAWLTGEDKYGRPWFDHDNDGIYDYIDNDDDNDGRLDSADSCPYNPIYECPDYTIECN